MPGSGPPTPQRIPTAGGYVHPFPKDDWTPGRIDQGQDFAPKRNGAPILAPGRARVVKLGAPGWPPTGKGILLKLEDGEKADAYIYINETLTPSVSTGAVVPKGTKIAEGQTGGTGIEIGWADRTGATLSRLHGTAGSKDTPAGTPEGRDMASWLSSLPEQGGALIPSPGQLIGDAAGAAGDAAGSLAGKIISALFDALAPEGARILLYLGLVLGGTFLTVGGISVMMGGTATGPIKAAVKGAKVIPVPV